MGKQLPSSLETLLGRHPIEVRILTRMAAANGLEVHVENIDGEECVSWRGSNEQFSALSAFDRKISFASIKRKKYVYPNGLRGHIYRQEDGSLKFVILWCHLSSRPIRHMRAARADFAYRKFRTTVLSA